MCFSQMIRGERLLSGLSEEPPMLETGKIDENGKAPCHADKFGLRKPAE